MRTTSERQSTPIRHAALGAVLTLSLVVLVGAGPTRGSSRTAVPNLPNAAAQRLAMLDALKSIEGRLDSMEKLFSDGELTVKIGEMPEVIISE